MNRDEERLSGIAVKAVNSDAETITDKNGCFELKVAPYVRHIEASFGDYVAEKAEIDGSYIVFKLKLNKQMVKAKARAEAEDKRDTEKVAAENARYESVDLDLSVTSAISNDGESKSEESASSNAYGKWGSNWFVAANLGANLYHGTTMTLTKESENIFDHAAFALDLYFGKWHTPVFGWRAGYRGLGMKAFDKTSKNKDWESVSYLNFHFDAMLNLCNLIGGYKIYRVWNVIPYAGLGWAARGKSMGDSAASMGYKRFVGSLAVNAGILQEYRLSNRWAANVEIGATILRNGFSSKPNLRGYDVMWTATVGVSFKLGKMGWGNPY